MANKAKNILEAERDALKFEIQKVKGEQATVQAQLNEITQRLERMKNDAANIAAALDSLGD